MLLTGPSGLFAVYLIQSENSTYIGFTPDPRTRLRKHNREIAGGARATKNKVWKLNLFVYGFATKVSALQFERQWQLPNKTAVTQKQTNLKSSKKLEKCVDILKEMLNLDMWRRQPLKVAYVDYECFSSFKDKLRGEFLPNFLIEKGENMPADQVYKQEIPNIKCSFCREQLSEYNVKCDFCMKSFCMTCLAQFMVQDGNQLIPEKGTCICGSQIEWKLILESKIKDLAQKRNNLIFCDNANENDEKSESSQQSEEENNDLCENKLNQQQSPEFISVADVISPQQLSESFNIQHLENDQRQTPTVKNHEEEEDLEVISID